MYSSYLVQTKWFKSNKNVLFFAVFLKYKATFSSPKCEFTNEPKSSQENVLRLLSSLLLLK